MTSKTAEEAAAVSEIGQKFDYSGDALPTAHPHSLGQVGIRTVSVGDALQKNNQPPGLQHKRTVRVKPPSQSHSRSLKTKL